MVRKHAKAAYLSVRDAHASDSDNAGLLLDRGLIESTSANRGENVAKLIGRASDVPIGPIYSAAFSRWSNALRSATVTCWKGKVQQRLFIAKGECTVLDAAVGLSPTYGVPRIVGTTLKGIAAAAAYEDDIARESMETLATQLFPSEENAYDCLVATLFGRIGDRDDKGDAGYLIFHDAWWVPHSAPTPLVPEVITPHHADYYDGKEPNGLPRGTESPNPVPQIAVHGEFMFAIEGEPRWAKWGAQLLQAALSSGGVGGLGHVGYGLFFD